MEEPKGIVYPRPHRKKKTERKLWGWSGFRAGR